MHVISDVNYTYITQEPCAFSGSYVLIFMLCKRLDRQLTAVLQFIPRSNRALLLDHFFAVLPSPGGNGKGDGLAKGAHAEK